MGDHPAEQHETALEAARERLSAGQERIVDEQVPLVGVDGGDETHPGDADQDVRHARSARGLAGQEGGDPDAGDVEAAEVATEEAEAGPDPGPAEPAGPHVVRREDGKEGGDGLEVKSRAAE